MKRAKRISALICVFVICFTLISVPSASASGGLVPQSFGAWISAALASINIIGQSLMPAPGPVDPYFKWLASPASASQTYQYPVSQSVIQDYMNASTVVVRQGVTTIDGVEYDEVFVEPGTFTNGLKTNIFDFKTKWNILSGQSGIILAEGVGYIDGCPVYRLGQNPQNLRTPIYNLAVGGNQCGNISVYMPSGYDSRTITYSNGTSYRTPKFDSKDVHTIYWYSAKSTLSQGDVRCDMGGNAPTSLCVDDPFKYGYTSGIVPADQSEIPENYGLSLQIPHDQLQTFYNTYPQYNVDNSVINIQEDQIDIDQLTQAIFDQITSMEDIKSEWTDGEQPEPPTPVDPIENIDQNVQDISDYQRMLIDYIDEVESILTEQGQNVGFINSALQDLKSQIDQDSEYIESSAGHLQNILQENGIYYEDFKDLMQDIKQDNQSYHDDMKQEVDHMHQDVEAMQQTQQQQYQMQQQQYQQQQQQTQQQQQINQNTSSIKDTIESVTETPTSEDLPDFKFDLRELFPFCIPFDIYRLLSSFDGEPEAPHVQLPIVIDSINFRYMLDLDFSAWNPVAQAMRTAELIVYAIALAWATGKVIKW